VAHGLWAEIMFELDMNHLVGKVNVLWITLDSLRYDTAQQALYRGKTPFFQKFLPQGTWEKREAPGTFTLPSHTAYFHGFFPTLPGQMRTLRPLSLAFERSTTVNEKSYIFKSSHLLEGFTQLGYRTCCIGGVGFFNKKNPMGSFLPHFFQESFWDSACGEDAPLSAQHQCQLALQWLKKLSPLEKFVLFINFSATHCPHGHYLGQTQDSVLSQVEALHSIDFSLSQLLPPLLEYGDCLCFWMSDHGDAYGEDGLYGHRFAHPCVSTIPYAQMVLPGRYRSF
jgi:hypothetical protein